MAKLFLPRTRAGDPHGWSFSPTSLSQRFTRKQQTPCAIAFVAIMVLLALSSRAVFAQNTPSFTTVDPISGKVNDQITVTGENLGKASVSAVFLSDDKNDYKATIVEQSDSKIVMKVPQVKPGSYNVSYQKGNAIYIQPVRFTVE